MLKDVHDRGTRGGRPSGPWRGWATAWALAVSAGLGMLQAHAARPGSPGDPPRSWPAGGRLAPAVDRPTLVLFLSGGCPCSGASLAEFGRLLARAPGPIEAILVGDGSGEARLPPGARVLDDPAGEEAARFGVATSGHALLFGPGGRRLLFSGGITPARGHEGDSDGADALLRLAAPGATPPAAPATAPVYGCDLPAPGPTVAGGLEP